MPALIFERDVMQSQGLCDTTMTERFYNPTCVCPTYQNNLGPCAKFEAGMNGRCVYCDHEEGCHPDPTSLKDNSGTGAGKEPS
jgi:hypothetical protein